MKLPTKTMHCMECGKAFSDSQTALFTSIDVTRVLCGACFDERVRVNMTSEDQAAILAVSKPETVH